MPTKATSARSRCCCCSETFVIHPVVAVYGFLWYLNSIYGVVLMILESANACFYDWCPVCIVNTTIPIIWLLVITMVDSCCIRYWSLKQWNRRHYGAAFLYFAIFTNQLIIFGTLCFYGFTVWKKSVASTACHASDHLLYGFIALITTSTLLILWIGIYQFYAATKYLCTYTAVLDVKRRQLHSSPHLKGHSGDPQQSKHTMFNFKRSPKQMARRKSSIDSHSMRTASFSIIQTIYRHGDDGNDATPADHISHKNGETKAPHTTTQLAPTNEARDDHNEPHINVHSDAYKFPPPPLTPFASERSVGDAAINELLNECQVTPLTSVNPLSVDDDIESVVHNNGIIVEQKDNKEKESETEPEKECKKEVSASFSDSASPSKSTTHIEIAGIVIPTRRFTKHTAQKNRKKRRKRRKNKQHDHKRYKEVNKVEQKQTDDELDEDEDADDEAQEYDAIEMTPPDVRRNDDLEARKSRFLKIAIFGKGVEIITKYFDRLKEDPSTADLCIICYDSFKNEEYLARLKCKHVYHKNCIRIWLANNHSCPLCNLNEKNLNLKLNIHKNS